jgi:ATP-dependent Clp protease protease subunit
MSKKSINPVARVPNVRSDMSAKALGAWNADLKYVQASENEATISILEPIGQDFWGDGVTAKRIAAALRSIGERDVTVVINSPGGDVFDGLSIYGLLADHKGKVTVKILGLAASAASIIAMAGDEIQIMRSGFLMIHNAWVMVAGDRAVMQETINFLEPIDQALRDVYAVRTGIEAGELQSMMDRETWLAGSTAVDRGFADGLLGGEQIDADAQAETRLSPQAAKRRTELLLSRAGCSRTEGRALLAQIRNSGTQDAAHDGMHDAAVVNGISDIVSDLSNFKIS